METCCVVLTFKSVDEILWFDPSNETPSAVLFMVPVVFQHLTFEMKFGIFPALSPGSLTFSIPWSERRETLV